MQQVRHLHAFVRESWWTPDVSLIMSKVLISSFIHLYQWHFLFVVPISAICFSITKVPLISILHPLISISRFLLPLTLSSTRRRVHFPCPPFRSTFCLKHSSICPLNVLCPCVSRLWHILNLSPLPRMSFGRPAALRQLHSHSSFPHPSTPPPHPSPTPLCAACCPAAFIYRCTLQCLQHRSTSVCLVQQHHHTSSQAETLLTHKHKYTTTLTLAYEVQRKTMDRGKKNRTVGICLTGSTVSQNVVMFVAQHELLKRV